MSDWKLRPVDPVALATTGSQDTGPEDRRRQPRWSRRVQAPALLTRLFPGKEPANFEIEVLNDANGELQAFVVRDRTSGRELARFEGDALQALLNAPGASGFIVERSG